MPLVLTSHCSHWLMPQPPLLSPLLFWDTLWVLSVCQSGVAGVLPGVVGLQRSYLAIQRAQQRSIDLCFGARSREQRYMVHCGGGGGKRHTPRACVCCACITGTITCTNCPTSQVVRYNAHMKYTAFVQIFVKKKKLILILYLLLWVLTNQCWYY